MINQGFICCFVIRSIEHITPNLVSTDSDVFLQFILTIFLFSHCVNCVLIFVIKGSELLDN